MFLHHRQVESCSETLSPQFREQRTQSTAQKDKTGRFKRHVERADMGSAQERGVKRKDCRGLEIRTVFRQISGIRGWTNTANK